MTALSGRVEPATWDRTWHDALDALELDVADVEALITALHADADWDAARLAAWSPAWQAPTTPLPATLADRARALLARHQRAAEQITRAMVGNRRQQRLAASLDQRTDARPVYIDTAV